MCIMCASQREGNVVLPETSFGGWERWDLVGEWGVNATLMRL